MQIPKGPNGFPTLSANSLRTYGAGGFRLLAQEEEKGCPRLWKAQYVERRVKDMPSYALKYGSMMHRVLFRMEEHAVGPEEALDAEFDHDLPPEAFREALDDLTRYLERGASPVDRYGTIAVETELTGLLYEDEEYGPTYYRGFLDWLGVDLDADGVLHVVDYKTNRFPPSEEAVRGDVQLKGYAWLAIQNWQQFMPHVPFARVVVHLDAIKWRDIEVEYTREEIEDWHSWCVAVARRIWRDEEAAPVLNAGCAFCPVRNDCPAFLDLPENGEGLLVARPEATMSDDVRLAWRDRAWKVKGLLEKAVEEIDEEFKERVRTVGSLSTTAYEFRMETDWANRIDARALHRILGERFYEVISVGKGKVESLIKDWTPDDVAAVKATFARVPVGSKVAKKKR